MVEGHLGLLKILQMSNGSEVKQINLQMHHLIRMTLSIEAEDLQGLYCIA